MNTKNISQFESLEQIYNFLKVDEKNNLHLTIFKNFTKELFLENKINENLEILDLNYNTVLLCDFKKSPLLKEIDFNKAIKEFLNFRKYNVKFSFKKG